MCKALELTQMMNEKVIEAKNYHYTLGKKLSTLDLAQQDLLHKIENMDKFNLMEAWEITKALNELRHERRIIKDELETMNIFMNVFIEKSDIDVKLSSTFIQVTDKNAILDNKRKNKIYTNRVMNLKNDTLKSTSKLLDNLNNTNFNIYSDLLKNKPIDNSYNNSTNYISIAKIYNFGEKVLKKDKGKGSSIKIRYITEKQSKAILNIIVPQFETFSINTNQKYFHLINKKF